MNVVARLGGTRTLICLAWVALLLPTFFAVGAYINTSEQESRQALSERVGVRYIAQLDGMIEAGDTYRATANAATRRHAAQRIAATFATLSRMDASVASRLALGDDLQDLRAGWRRVTISHSAAALDDWIDFIVLAQRDIADHTNLTYDENLERLNLADALVWQFATSSERLTRIAYVLRRKSPHNQTPAGHYLVARLETQAADTARLGAADLAEIVHVSTGMAPVLGHLGPSLDDEFQRFDERLVSSILNRTTFTSPDLADVALRVAADQRRLERLLRHYLDDGLAAKLADEDRKVITIVGALLIFIVLSLAIVVALIRAVALTAEAERIRAERRRELALREVQRDLQSAEAKFRVTFEEVPVGILIVEDDLTTTDANPALEALVNDTAGIVAADRELFASALHGGDILRFERQYQRPDESVAWAEVALRGIAGPSDDKRYVLATFRDVTTSKALSDQLLHDSTHDSLTGLPNRAYFEGALRSALRRSRDHASERFSLLFLDLDDFKIVNDSVGHHAGDALLVATAHRLRGILRSADIVCRMGGDEFALLIADRTGEEAAVIAARIVETVCEPFVYLNNALVVRASVGIVPLGDGSQTPHDALRDADTAMYEAKSGGGGRSVHFDRAMHAAASRRMRLTADLRAAIDANALDVAYQPIFDLHSREICGFEALARWTHAAEGIVPPIEFIPIAESAGLIELLGRNVLLQSCRQLAAWRQTHPLAAGWHMNVNVAAAQVVSGSIVEDVRLALLSTGIPADRLTLEITESVLIDKVSQATQTLEVLRELGIRICVDDFGTGYSSLQYLARFPVNAIKIDRSFVSGEADTVASEPIVQIMVTTAHVLGLGLVAEGIESETQRARLLAMGCTHGQGYALSPPLPADQLTLYGKLRALPNVS